MPGGNPGIAESGRGHFIWSRRDLLSLAAWLFITLFVWVHTTPEGLSTLAVAILTAALSFLAARARYARFIKAALAIWLFVSAFALPHDPRTSWNNALVAILIFVVSLLGWPRKESADTIAPAHAFERKTGPDLPAMP